MIVSTSTRAPSRVTIASRVDALDPVRHHGRIRCGQRRVVVVRQDRPLAAEPVARHQLRAQLAIADLAAQVRAAERLDRLDQPRAPAEADPGRLVHREEQVALHVLGLRHQSVEQPLGPGYRAVEVRQHPRRRALEHGERADARLDLRHELRRGRPGADDGDALALERVVPVPARRVEAVSGERVEPGDVRLVRLGGGADRRDDDIGREFTVDSLTVSGASGRRSHPSATRSSRNRTGCAA